MKYYMLLIFPMLLLFQHALAFGQEIEDIPSVNEIRDLLADIPEDSNTEITVMLVQKGKPIVPSLLEIMTNREEDIYIRKHAAGILGAIKDGRTIDTLIDCLYDNECPIQKHAAFALREITHRDFREKNINWKAWWKENREAYLNQLGDCVKLKAQKGKNNLPCWIIDFIAREKLGPVGNPPRAIERCQFRDQTVYHIPPLTACCDTMSALYDEKGSYLCSPGGGLTGRGDGKCPDFYQASKTCDVIWKDSRSYSNQ